MKIAVYAISKNESKFVDRFMDSIKDADGVFVLDTGSTDDTVLKLEQRGAIVSKEEINPWRFDVARNKSLELVPLDYDVCICLDLDEVIKEGWREKILEVWKEDTTRLRYTYNWKLENDKPVISFYAEKIHSRKGYKWIHPVHEILKGENEVFVTTDDITINHYPDDTKSRSSYLPLLELSVQEDPFNDRNMHYLGREYMYYGRYQECIDTLIKHLNLPKATWKDERCASMRFIARSYKNLNRYEEARMWLEKAIKEAPYLRDGYVEMMLLNYLLEEWELIIKYGNEALKILKHPKTYINEPFTFDHTVYDLLSIAYYNLNDYEKSLDNINKALEISPNDERLINNKKIIENMI